MSVFEELAAKEHLPFDTGSLASSLTDTLLAATVAQVDVTCVVLKFLVQSLLDVVKQFDALIPDGIYLPAPPVYCPQPILTEEERARHSGAELVELRLRRRVSVILSLIVLVMGSSRVARPAAQWYAAKVVKACAQRIQLEGGSGGADIDRLLQGYVSSRSVFSRDEGYPSVQVVLSCFRDVASVLWMMEARDKLSMLLREKKTEAEKSMSDNTSLQNRKWKSLCRDALNWSIHLLPFREMSNVERQIHNVVLSLILEMPANARTAQTLGEHFPKAENLDPDIQEKLQSILKDWQANFLSENASGDAQTGMTMNLIYCEASANADRNIARKRSVFRDYDELVFRNPENSLEIGSRPFESCVEFAQFLEMFYDVCLGRTVEEAGHAKQRLPLLEEYSSEVRKRELNSLPKKALSRATSEIISVEKPFQSQQPVPAKRKLNEVKTLVEVPKIYQRKVGLFRSLSTGDVSRRSEGVITRSSSVVSVASNVTEREAPLELDVLAPDATMELSRSLRKKMVPPSSGNRNNNSSNMKVNAKDIQRATSLVERTGSNREPEALSAPLVPSWMLERMEFGEGFGELERLTEWMMRWAGRTNAFNDSSVLGVSTLGIQRPAILVRVTPKLLTYSLWLIENFGKTRAKSFEPVENEITVAMVREVGASAPGSRTGSVRSPGSRTGSIRSDRRKSKTETIEEEVQEEREEEKSSDVEDFVPSPVQRRSSSADVAPVPRERNKNLRRGSRDDEFDEMAVFNASFRDDKDGKKKDKREKKKKSLTVEEEEEDPSDKIFDKDSEQTVISYDIVVSEFETGRFSLEEPQEEVRVVQGNLTTAETLRTDSESSIAVSSLTGDDLRQTMKDTLIALTGNKNASIKDEREDAVVDGQERRASSAPLQHAAYNEQPLPLGPPDTGIMQPDLTTELQRVIRDEMRRIMTAQQKGILAMLNSLEPSDESLQIPPMGNGYSGTIPNGNPPVMNRYAGAVPNVNPPRMNGYLPNGNPQGLNRPYNPRPPVIPQQYAVYMMQADMPPVPEKFTSQSTDGSVTPLMSDSKLDDWMKETPLKVSDLNKTDARKDFRNPVVRDALRELDQLRIKSNTRPLLFAPAPYGPFSNRPGLMDRNFSMSNANQGKPFSDLMEALRQMNGKMFPSFRIPPNANSVLLRFPPPENQFRFPIRFPNVPSKSLNLKEKTAPENHLSSIAPTPLLQRNYFIREPPDRDTGGATTLPPTAAWNDTSARLPPPFSHAGMSAFPPRGSMITPRQGVPVFHNRMPFPLLHLPDMNRVGVRPAFFVPPPSASGYMPNADQHVQDQSQSSAPMKEQPEGKDTRERRQATRPGLNETSEVRGRSSEVQDSEASAEEKKEEEGPVRLHAGYALTPGMFDEYLGQQDELGSAADTNAKLQYQAAMALKSQPKGSGVLKKDMFTETNEEELHGSDPVADAIGKYYRQNRLDHPQSGPLLPPDVFMQLRFADGQRTDASQMADGMRSYINVVDINSEMLTDIVSSVRDKQSRPEVALATASSAASPSHVTKETSASKVTPEESAEAVVTSGPDAVTYNLFNRKVASTGTLLSPAKLKNRSKGTIDGMNERMNEIARMAQKMQRDFETTKLVVNKLEDVGNKVLEEKERRRQDEFRPSERQPGRVDEFGGNTTELRLTNLTADELLERALETTRGGAEVTHNDLQELFKALSPRRPGQEKVREEDEKRLQLLEWMEKKKMERMRKYRNEMEEKRGSEVHPYAPKATQKMLTRKTIEAFEEDRATKRKKMQLQNMELRTQEAAGLLNEMLSDQPNLSKPSVDRPINTADTTLRRYRPSPFNASHTSKGSPQSARKSKFPTDDYSEYLRLLDSCEREAELILKGGVSFEGTARVEEKQSSERKPETERENGKVTATDKTFRLKSFKDVVKLQRPEVTRQSRPLVAKRSLSVQDNTSTSRRETSLEEKQRIYGSSHIPGSARQKPMVRTVKTYTQRLQEMKQSPGKENEIRWRYQTGPTLGSQSLSVSGQSESQTTRKSRQKPRQTLTYAEQLKQLQPPKEHRDSNSASPLVKATLGLRWHKPAHRPKTYTEQLQELQRPATVRLERMRPAIARLVPQQRPSERSPALVPRSQRRSRPYADPYSDVDATSDVSAWSMDDNVRKILYGDRSPQLAASDTDLSELMALRDRETPLDYTEMVDIHDLEMIDSVSLNSCLDWEEIDRMVADIS